MPGMIIRNAAIFTDDRKLHVKDVVPYKDEPWIVAEWVANEDGGPRRAKRLIRLKSLRFAKGPVGGIADVMVNTIIPTAVLNGEEIPKPGSPIQVVENPVSVAFSVEKSAAS